MELELNRTYHNSGTNGAILHNGEMICAAIELPWINNQPRTSCIPEGRYELKKRYSAKFGWHLEVLNVPARAWILIHPANDAVKELKGCIAPVSITTGPGKGLGSRKALQKLKVLIYPVLDGHERVTLIIKKQQV